MSYDIEVYTKNVHYEGNYTSNVEPMFSKAYKEAQVLEDNEYKAGIHKWHELVFSDFKDCLAGDRECSLRALQYMIKAMEDDPTSYRKLNPDNGWGSYEGALIFLKMTYKALEANKNSIVNIDY